MLRAIVAFLIGAVVAASATYLVIERNPAAVSGSLEPSTTVGQSASSAVAPTAKAASAASGDLGLARRQLVAEFRAWAARDAESALAALGALESVADRRVVAAGLLTVLGSDEATIARITAAVPGTDATSLRVEALLEHAARDASGALQAALATEDGTARRIALPQIGAAWALEDPLAALSSAAMIGVAAEAAAFNNGVLRQWAQTDIDAFLAYFAQSYGIGGSIEKTAPLVDALGLAAVIDADRVLAFADRLDEAPARAVRSQALQAMVTNDPVETLARLAAMPVDQREALLPGVAMAYGRLDPDAALAWARSLDPPSPQVLQAVMTGIQSVAPERTVDPALAGGGTFAPTVRALTAMAADSQSAPPILAALDDSPESRSMRSMTLLSWARRDPEAALEWLKANPLPDADLTLVLPRLAETFAARDAEAALRMTDTLPENMRVLWRAEVDAYRAQSDPTALARLFANASVSADGSAAARYSAIQPALGAARANPAAAFAQLGNASEDVRSTIVMTIMPDWASTNPTEASRWAADVDDADLRGIAVRQVALGWGREDIAAARRWVVDLPKDPARDTGLGALLLAVAREQGIDESLLPEFSSDQARQEAIVSTARSIAISDPAGARAVLDRYVTDPEIRRAGELEIERARTILPGTLRPTPLPTPNR